MEDILDRADGAFSEITNRLTLGHLVGLVALNCLLSTSLTVLVARQPFSKPLLLVTGVGVPVVINGTLWTGVAVWIYVATRPFSGGGSFRKTFELTGWGLLPGLGSSSLGLLAVVVVWSTNAGPLTPSLVYNSTPLVAAQAVGLTLVVFQWALWTLAVRHARDVSWRVATLVGGLPAVAVFSLELSRLVG